MPKLDTIGHREVAGLVSDPLIMPQRSGRRSSRTRDPIARVEQAARAARLPEFERSTWFGTPSLKVRGKSFLRLKDDDTLVLLCPLEWKEILLTSAPDVYFETDHYKGWPAILARLSRIKDKELKAGIVLAWRQKAPKKLIGEFDARARR